MSLPPPPPPIAAAPAAPAPIRPLLQPAAVLPNTITITQQSFLHYTLYTFSIIIFLAICGLNVFVYLAKGTNTVVEFIDKLLDKIYALFGQETVDIFSVICKAFVVGFETAATQSSAVQAATAITTGGIYAVDALDGSLNGIPIPTSLSQPSLNPSVYGGNNSSLAPVEPSVNIPPPPPLPPSKQQPGAATTAASAAASTTTTVLKPSFEKHPIADSVNSIVQSTVAKNKAGWCYIGEDRGYRSCVEVDEDEGCMSQQVFPSQESCLNPELRYS